MKFPVFKLLVTLDRGRVTSVIGMGRGCPVTCGFCPRGAPSWWLMTLKAAHLQLSLWDPAAWGAHTFCLGACKCFILRNTDGMKSLFLFFSPQIAWDFFNLNKFLLCPKCLIDSSRKEVGGKGRESRLDHPNWLLSHLNELSDPGVLQRQGGQGPPKAMGSETSGWGQAVLVIGTQRSPLCSQI